MTAALRTAPAPMRALPPDLARLLEAVARGDRAAFAALYRATAPKLLGVANRILRDRQAAEDVVQDAFVKVWRSAGSYSAASGAPMTWLVAVTRYRAIDVARSRGLRRGRDAVDLADCQDGLADPRDQEGDLIRTDSLSRCLDRLGDEQRRCFVLAYQDGLSREELADQFGRPVNTIKTWLHRSAAQLRSCLEDAR